MPGWLLSAVKGRKQVIIYTLSGQTESVPPRVRRQQARGLSAWKPRGPLAADLLVIPPAPRWGPTAERWRPAVS